MRKLNNEERKSSFLAKVDTSGGPDSCWNWKANGQRYGRFWANGRMVQAHRFSWEMHNGPVPDGLCVCHRCDNPRCVNPVHLFLGTMLDNVRDMIAKGRARHDVVQVGENNRRSKLRACDIQRIREDYRPGVITHKMLADRLGVSTALVSLIVRREIWKHVP